MKPYEIKVLFEADCFETAVRVQDAVTKTISIIQENEGITGCFEILQPQNLDDRDD